MPFLSAISFDADPSKNLDAGRAITFNHNFSTSAQSPAVQTEKVSLADLGMNTCKMVFVDNSQSPAPSTLLIKGVFVSIVTPPYSQAYHHIPNSPLDLDYQIVNYGGILAAGYNVNLTWFNVKFTDECVWNIQPDQGLQGTPFAASTQGANTALAVSMNAQTGRRSYISTIELTGAGSTAGAAVNATLTNIDGGAGVGVTLNWAFTFPVGPLVAANPVIVDFSPPIPVLLGANAVLTLPAGGSGNTNAAVSMDGFYV